MLARLSGTLDRLCWWLKWPTGLVMLFLLPGLVVAWGDLFWRIGRMVFRPGLGYGLDQPLLPFVAGLVVYGVLWRLLFRRWPGFFSTLGHELTHAVFAWCTLHWVSHFRASLSKGGEIQYRRYGPENWLITIAPYFFPTFAVAMLIGLVFVPRGYAPWASGALGVLLGFHVLANWRQTHGGQSDLKKVGWFFAALFLPSANLLVIGLIVAWVVGRRPACWALLYTSVREPWCWWIANWPIG